MAHAVSATFTRFEHMSPPAAVGALLLHALVAFLLWWSSPLHQTDDPEEKAIEVTMEAPPPPPVPKPEPKPAPESPKPPVAAAKPPPTQQMPLPGLAPRGAIGPKDMYPKLEKGPPTTAAPTQAEPPTQEKPEPPEPPPQQALAKPAEPTPPPPPLEKELPPVEAPPAPLTSRDIARTTPPVPEKKPEPAPAPVPHPTQPQAQPARPVPQPLPSSPLSRLQRNVPSPQNEQPRSQFVNPADTYTMNTVAQAYQYQVVDRVGRYQANLAGATPDDNVVVRFTIARNGSLLAIAVVRSSGKPAIDRGLVTAFQQVAPFPPLPPEIPGDSATFTLTFGPRFRQR